MTNNVLQKGKMQGFWVQRNTQSP